MKRKVAHFVHNKHTLENDKFQINDGDKIN